MFWQVLLLFIVGEGGWGGDCFIWKWMFRWNWLGFHGGYFPTRQLCWALEAASLGQGFSCLFWRWGRIEICPRPWSHWISGRPHINQTRCLPVIFWVFVLYILFCFHFLSATVVYIGLLFPGSFTGSSLLRMLYLLRACQISFSIGSMSTPISVFIRLSKLPNSLSLTCRLGVGTWIVLSDMCLRRRSLFFLAS